MNNVDDILERIVKTKESKPALNELTSNSKVSVWLNIAYIIASAINEFRLLFVQHKFEIDEEIRTQKVHRKPWLRSQLLNFQYGFDLIPETDKFINGDATDEEIEDSKIIKYAAVTESEDEKRLIAKIATEVGDELTPVTETQKEAVLAWLKEIKAAGVPVTVINYLPDLLQVNIRIFRDPLLLDSNGVHRITGKVPAEEALREFMKELPFNGELYVQELANKLEKVEGVNAVQVDSLLSTWINAETNNYGVFTAIDVRRIPVSGYFKIENFNGISYVV